MPKKGETVSEATRAKMSAAHQQRWKKHRGLYLQTCNYINIGSKRSKKTKLKMSMAHRGKKRSPATIEKIRLAMLTYHAEK